MSVTAGKLSRGRLPRMRSTSFKDAESAEKLTAARHGPIEPLIAARHSTSSQPSSPAIHVPINRSTPQRLSHLTSTGDARMVDISRKIPTRRSAAATAFVLFSNPNPYASLTDKTLPKGDAIAVARIAGIQATKKTADLIPLAHPGLGITGVKVGIHLLTPSATECTGGSPSDHGEAGFEFGGVKITAQVSCDGKTGVEMEALTGANMAALTIYDMCKAVDKHMLITGVRVITKTGGKSRNWSLDGDIPDPVRSPIFESVLQRRAAGIVYDQDHHTPADIPDPTRAAVDDVQDPPVVPEATADFLKTATSELDLFVANTTSPAKAAEIAGLRRRHKALKARIREIQNRLSHGYEDGVSGEQLRDGRVDFDALQLLRRQREEVARKVLGWRIGAGSEIGELTQEEANVFLQTNDDCVSDVTKAGEWRWEAGVWGAWKDDNNKRGGETVAAGEEKK
jgi:molybdenum cofactor biosynthesis enzyme